jgi:hypothetical protein
MMPVDGMRTPSSILLATVLALVMTLPVLAAQRVNKNSQDVAILGYDTVAYFTEGRPVEGSAQFEHVWRDARWRFSSADNRDLFAADPARYAPRYGGFCAGAMAQGWRVTVDPEAWVIIDDKLYLNYDRRMVDDFASDADDRIAKADANWQHLGKVE